MVGLLDVGLCEEHWRVIPGETKQGVRRALERAGHFAMARQRWRAQRMARLAMRPPSDRVRQGEINRADGGGQCDQCGSLYRDHPNSQLVRSGIDGTPYLTVLCDGRFVKL
jgi:hypothetical protein